VDVERYRTALMEAAEEVERIASSGRLDRDCVERIKLEVARRYSLDRAPSSAELSSLLSYETRRLIAVRPSRRLSGIVTATVAAMPYDCPPNARCIYCPGGARMGTPKSYIEESPAVVQASRLGYDSRAQMEERLSVLGRLGYPTGKVEVIIVGGTFPHYPVEYQMRFVKGVFDGLNGFASGNLEEAMAANEHGAHRCVGLTVETRPDVCGKGHVDLMLSYGVTRVEVGVQTLDERTLTRIGRGHGTAAVVDAIRILKDAGLKVGVHMMPCLPGRTRDEDLEDIMKLFSDEAYRPDMLKIYPTLVLRGTPLHLMYERGLYEPCDEDDVVELLVRALASLPPWVRVMRIQREIPPYAVVAGPRTPGLRDRVLKEMARRGLTCTEIRCREVGREDVHPYMLERFRIVRRDYRASGGTEAFLSFEDDSAHVAGFLRLRRPSTSAHRPEIAGMDAAIVRELRVYGMEVDVGVRDEMGWQHRGIGKMLMDEAERLSRDEWGAEEMLVTSAVGTREYYRKLGYGRMGPYMAKRIR
jgi:elongator complex protein 3